MSMFVRVAAQRIALEIGPQRSPAQGGGGAEKKARGEATNSSLLVSARSFKRLLGGGLRRAARPSQPHFQNCHQARWLRLDHRLIACSRPTNRAFHGVQH